MNNTVNRFSARKLCYAIGLSLLTLSTAHAAADLSRAKLAINKQGIKVWTYQLPDNPAFNYRATTVLNSSVTSVAAVILDTDDLVQWVPYVSAVNVIERNDATGSFIIRMQLDFPFPLQDRDVVIQGKISQASDGTVTIKNRAVSDSRVPVRHNVVRLTHYEGDWTLKPLGPAKTEVSTTGYGDPGGVIPLTVANMFVQQQPYQMLGRMKDYVKNSRYQNAQLSMIKDPYAKK
ncbi:START domain-containing protein [Alkanindiges illinoisensis]|uniref:START domain-containing protein n=1 Tax=Alkanindiges illinoisensis TaxID=197183 RepID=UPI000A024BE8|nr:START domain-containing protein [Alkanindiges illinoisensis]